MGLFNLCGNAVGKRGASPECWLLGVTAVTIVIIHDLRRLDELHSKLCTIRERDWTLELPSFETVICTLYRIRLSVNSTYLRYF